MVIDFETGKFPATARGEISIDYIIHRLTFDNAHERTETAQSAVKALLFV